MKEKSIKELAKELEPYFVTSDGLEQAVLDITSKRYGTKTEVEEIRAQLKELIAEQKANSTLLHSINDNLSQHIECSNKVLGSLQGDLKVLTRKQEVREYPLVKRAWHASTWYMRWFVLMCMFTAILILRTMFDTSGQMDALMLNKGNQVFGIMALVAFVISNPSKEFLNGIKNTVESVRDILSKTKGENDEKTK